MLSIHLSKILTALIVLCVILFFIPMSMPAAGAVNKKRLSPVVEADCSKCHESVVFSLRMKGGAHELLCLECHQGHPPDEPNIFPPCSRCHAENEHHNLNGCLGCHTNPHAPLEITLSNNITTPCLSCHKNQIEELQDNPSIHTKLACTACHNYHGQIQSCKNCHLPHIDTMGDESCGECHKAHMPLVVSYGENIVSEDCGSCHVGVYKDLVNTSSKHRNVACVACHTAQHGIIPACEKCHEPPHPEEILERFSSCGECHGLAHDLSATESATSIFIEERE